MEQISDWKSTGNAPILILFVVKLMKILWLRIIQKDWKRFNFSQENVSLVKKKVNSCADLLINFLLLLLQPDPSKTVLTSRAKRSISSLFPTDTLYPRNTVNRVWKIQFLESDKYNPSKTVLTSCAKRFFDFVYTDTTF